MELINILKIIWQEGGLPWWRVALVIIFLLVLSWIFGTIKNQTQRRGTATHMLDMGRTYIHVWIVSMLIFGPYGTVIPVFGAAIALIGVSWKFLTVKNEEGKTEAQKLWAEVEPYLPEKEAPEEKK